MRRGWRGRGLPEGGDVLRESGERAAGNVDGALVANGDLDHVPGNDSGASTRTTQVHPG